MCSARRNLDWDAISWNYAGTLNAMGGDNGRAFKPSDFHPYREPEQRVEHDITILKKLLPDE